MDASLPPLPVAAPQPRRPLVLRHGLTTRVTHWLSAIAFFILVASGLQIFNAAPYLDASDKSDPAHRVLWIAGGQTASGAPVGAVRVFGHTFVTTHVLGYTNDGAGESVRAFPAWLTLPGYQDLADGRRWHLFFAWVFVLCGIAYVARGSVRRRIGALVLRPDDVPKLVPMALYYVRLRPQPPPYDLYNPLQKAAYTGVIFVLAPLVVLTGLALSPGVDAIASPLVSAFGGRQFARLWHFVLMLALLGFVAGHLLMVVTQGFVDNMRSMITGRSEK